MNKKDAGYFMEKALDFFEQEGQESSACAYFYVAALLGEMEAWLYLAILSGEFKGIEHEDRQEIQAVFKQYYRESLEARASLGDRDCAYKLAAIFEFGDGVPVNETRAIQIYTELAQSGDNRAQYSLFEKYMIGWCGIEQDYEKAMYWLRKSARNGNAEGKERLKEMETYEKNRCVHPWFRSNHAYDHAGKLVRICPAKKR